MKDRASGKSRGFGFVTYWSAADAQRVLEGNHVVDGRRCEVPSRVLQPLHARRKYYPVRALTSACAALGCAHREQRGATAPFVAVIPVPASDTVYF